MEVWKCGCVVVSKKNYLLLLLLAAMAAASATSAASAATLSLRPPYKLASLLPMDCVLSSTLVAFGCNRPRMLVDRKKRVSLDHTRNCIHTSNKNKKIYPRIHSTVKVIRACIFVVLSVLEVTQRVPPTCTIIHISRTWCGARH
jgi:hypothetical protein